MPTPETIFAWHLVAVFLGGLGTGLALAALAIREPKNAPPEN